MCIAPDSSQRRVVGRRRVHFGWRMFRVLAPRPVMGNVEVMQRTNVEAINHGAPRTTHHKQNAMRFVASLVAGIAGHGWSVFRCSLCVFSMKLAIAPSVVPMLQSLTPHHSGGAAHRAMLWIGRACRQCVANSRAVGNRGAGLSGTVGIVLMDWRPWQISGL